MSIFIKDKIPCIFFSINVSSWSAKVLGWSFSVKNYFTGRNSLTKTVFRELFISKKSIKMRKRESVLLKIADFTTAAVLLFGATNVVTVGFVVQEFSSRFNILNIFVSEIIKLEKYILLI